MIKKSNEKIIESLFNNDNLKPISNGCNVTFKDVLSKLENKKIHSNEIMPLIDQLNPYDFEKIIAVTYTKLGYKVKLTKGSRDYGVDIFVEKEKEKACIQAKLYLKQKVNLKAVQEIYTAKGIYKCNKAIVITNGKFQKSAFISATKLQVLLFGRKRLKNMILEAFKILKKEGLQR